jgi:hypothetical protein
MIAKQFATDQKEKDIAQHEQDSIQRKAIPFGIGVREKGTNSMENDIIERRVNIVALVEEDRVIRKTMLFRNDNKIMEEGRFKPSSVIRFRVFEICIGQVI